MTESVGQRKAVLDLKRFGLSAERGFLPASDPLSRLPAAFEPWEQLSQELPKLLAARCARERLDRLPLLEASQLQTEAQRQRAMLLLSYFGHAYVWGEEKPAERIPAGIAVPWHAVALLLGRPPVLSYASYALYNWRRLDPSGPIALGNIALLQNFLGGVDEEWFILVHVDIEAKAGPALGAIVKAYEAATWEDVAALEQELNTVALTVERMNRSLLRMPERCDPYIYYNRVRPYIHGWKDHPGLPKGLVYEGVEAHGGQPQQFRGETGAQSAIVPVMDAVLGVEHKDDPLRPYLMEMRQYMDPGHRAFIEGLEAAPSIRAFVKERWPRYPALRATYNQCLMELVRFRTKHLEYAATYIQQQSQRSQYNPTQVGTGGTPFLPYLKKHVDETALHLIV